MKRYSARAQRQAERKRRQREEHRRTRLSRLVKPREIIRPRQAAPLTEPALERTPKQITVQILDFCGQIGRYPRPVFLDVSHCLGAERGSASSMYWPRFGEKAAPYSTAG
jgi:hypothetical protein